MRTNKDFLIVVLCVSIVIATTKLLGRVHGWF